VRPGGEHLGVLGVRRWHEIRHAGQCHDLEVRPARGREGQAIRRGGGLPVRHDVDRDHIGRRAGQADGVGIGDIPILRHHRVAARLDDDDVRGLVVVDLNVEDAADAVVTGIAPGTGVDHRVSDDRCRRILANCVVHCIDRQAHRVVPVPGAECDGAGSRVEPPITAADCQSRIQLQLDRDRPARRLGQRQQVLIGEAVRALEHHGLSVGLGARAVEDAIDLGDHQPRQVVVDDRDLDIPHLGPVEQCDCLGLGRGVRSIRVRRLDDSGDAVVHNDDALAFGQRIVRRLEADFLIHIPVIGVEHQNDRAVGHIRIEDALCPYRSREARVVRQCVIRHPQRVAPAFPLIKGGTCGRNRHVDLGACRRGHRQPHQVVVEQAALADGGAAARLGDQHRALRAGGDVKVDARRQRSGIDRVQRADVVVDHCAAALELEGLDLVCDVATDVDRIAAEAANDAHRHAEWRAQDVEVVVALEAVDFQNLDVVEADIHAPAENAVLGDDEVVGELGAQHHHLVEAGAAVDRDRGIDVVLDGVVVVAGQDVGLFCRRQAVRVARGQRKGHAGSRIGQDGAVRIRLRQREGPHDEQVVARIALEAQLGLVAINDEGIVAVAARGDQRCGRTRAQIAARGTDGGELVRCAEVRNNAVRAVDLGDLELVLALPTIKRGDDRAVVHGELVVASQAVHAEAAVQIRVVVDPLHVLRPNTGLVAVIATLAQLRQAAMKQRHEARRLRRLRQLMVDELHRAQQEDIVRGVGVVVGRPVEAVDVERVDAVVLRARIKHVDDVVSLCALGARGANDIGISIRLAVKSQSVVEVDRHGLQVVDLETVFAIVHIVGRARHSVGGVLAAVSNRAGTEVGPVEPEFVDVAVAEELGQFGLVAARLIHAADTAENNDIRAPVRIRILRLGLVFAAFTRAIGVAADTDIHPGDDLGAGAGGNIVAHPEVNRARGQHLADSRIVASVLRHQPVAAIKQVHVLDRHRRGVGHGKPDVATEGLEAQHVDAEVALRQVHAAVGLGIDATAGDRARHEGRGVDVEVILDRADAAAVGVEVDVLRADIGSISEHAVDVGRRGGIGIHDGPGARRQVHVGRPGDHRVQAQVTGSLVQEDARLGIRRHGTEGAAVEQVRLQKVRLGANGAAERVQRDVDTAHIGRVLGL